MNFWHPFQRREQDLDEEIRAHFAMAVRERIERGEDPAEAEAVVRREFGNRLLIEETTRDMWGWGWCAARDSRRWRCYRWPWGSAPIRPSLAW